MEWERRLMEFFAIEPADAQSLIALRKQKLALALKSSKRIAKELQKVELIEPKRA